ncbi:unconventional myosin-IXa-like isoform X2 [Sitodiplosis mosellana]|uniref:unconventional myosin-IXa-like isoform X2 n=1 Tax=Sitodiplosis mosellana TaxID=263140 RepID=UPI0024446AB3|nr:unconventional myosin-IXa-like isoform X2 [Sitodiplosis mosellana]XP_055305268.1 unconventional myosin-IXa-like isoform X2 [Sitodiplosis mosellana]
MQSTTDSASSSNCSRYILQVYVGQLSLHYEALSVEASKQTTAEEIVACIVERLSLTGTNYELAEVAGESKERRLSPDEKPVSVMLLWPLHSEKDFHRFYLRESQGETPWLDNYGLDLHIFRDFIPFLFQPENREYPDLCQLLDLNESTLLENLRQRFVAGHIYTYVGSILIAVNPFKFYPIYNPKYVRLYQNQRVGPILPPHIFAIADNAYYCMLREKRNQCVVISGESGSGKTESTNFLLHHLTALSQKGSHGSGVEQTILSAGPVLEAFGNAKTAHNNNSSRFGKFIQVKYKENGMVQGAIVQKYLLEKSRIVSQGLAERNYHVFYYLLSGATAQERELLHLLPAEKYCYLNSKNLQLENCDETYEFSRLKQSMEMVGFSAEKQRRLFNVLSAVLLLGNVEFFPKKSTYHHDESVQVRNIEVVGLISELLKVKQDTLLAALTSKRVKASGETLIMQYKLPEAIAARDALAKCLYGALFDWIVLQVNHALLNKDQLPHTGHSIGVLDIFGFEDFDSQNSFEQMCINYANEHLQYYFNLHVFKYEQNEYKKEGIKWRDIEFMDNSGCLQLFESKPTGLLCILDDLCNFPGATNETLLQKFNSVHRDNKFYEKPQKKENAFIIRHYAGKVKYQVTEMREKNLDLMRQDIVSVLKNSSMAFVRELVGADPVAVFRWAILRAFFRGYFAFRSAGMKHRKERNSQSIKSNRISRFRSPNESILRKNKSFRPRERPKKGLKNLQTVKTLTAGQNLLNSTTIKTRKQPLTVTAQFQNSLTALMDTLNQANPFFIRCIKSNSDKIPNKFDDATVVRQLRYTGMLETVRIRRAGYNVRLTYEEFIQLYRILLPKGLVSSQRDVRTFMDKMNLNKQHYQLGTTKIYMRESQKMCLDYKLHTKIIESIVSIQRWFKTKSQRDKFVSFRTAAIKIQSFWRMRMAQNKLYQLKLRTNAAIAIQSMFRMYRARKMYKKLVNGLILMQAHIRGRAARIRFKRSHRQKAMKERYKLRPTQSLPLHDRATPDGETIDVEISKSYPKLVQYSLDLIGESTSADATKNLLPTTVAEQDASLLNKAEHQFRSLMVSTKTTSSGLGEQITSDIKRFGNDGHSKSKIESAESVDSHSPRSYNVDTATKQYFDDSFMVKKWEMSKSPVRLIESSYSSPKRQPVSSSSLKSDPRETLNYNLSSSNVTKMQALTGYPDSTYANLSSKDKSSAISPTSVNNMMSMSKSVNLQSHRRELNTGLSYDETKLARFHGPTDLSPQHEQAYANSSIINNSNNSSNKQQQQPPDNMHLMSQNNTQTKLNSSPYKHLVPHSVEECTPRGKAAALLGTDSVITPTTMTTTTIKHKLSDSTGISHHHTPTRIPGAFLHSKSRRNSDPSSNKMTLLETNRGNDMYQSSTHINIAGHRFHKASKIGKNEKCASCQENDAFINEGHRCLDCRLLVHTKCIQNGGVKTLHCEKSSKRQPRKGSDKISSKYSGTREYTDSADKIISDAKELQLMQDFIAQKIYKMDADCDKTAAVDRVFKQALREFKDNLVAQYSIAHKQKSDTLNIKYRDLISNFEQVMETCGNKSEDFPLTMCVNGFRVFMNEFMNSREMEKPKAKRKKEKKRKVDEHTNYNGHIFQLTIINIPTACEICQLFLLWPIERGLVCQNCRLTCHKKCYLKTQTCNKVTNQSNDNAKYAPVPTSGLFGIPLTSLCCMEDNTVKIPVKIEQLITKIEMHGLYTEGLYRKSGVNSKIKELKMKMSESKGEIDYELYNVHVLANVLKSFLREMPEPLLTFDRYDDFLRASELSETTDRVSTMMSLIKKLPTAHHALLERLIFHLALVAQREQFNRMSASSLAIVFAPCVLRTNRIVPAQDSLNDIGRQTKCIETLITQKMVNVRCTLNDIHSLDNAAHTATARLSNLRSSKVFTPEEIFPRPQSIESESEEKLLEDHLQEIEMEKAILTSTLPSLARASSDDDFLSTDMEAEGEGGSLDDLTSSRLEETTKESIDSSFGSISEPQLSPMNDSSNKDSSGMDLESPVACYNLREQNIDYLPPGHRQMFQFSGMRDRNMGDSTPSTSTSVDFQQPQIHTKLIDSQKSSSASIDSANLGEFQHIQLTASMQRQPPPFINQPDDDNARTNKQKPTKRRTIDDKPIMV